MKHLDLTGRTDGDFQRMRLRHLADMGAFAFLSACLYAFGSTSAAQVSSGDVLRGWLELISVAGLTLLTAQLTWLVLRNPLGAFSPLNGDRARAEVDFHVERSPLARAHLDRIRDNGRQLFGADLRELRRLASLDERYLLGARHQEPPHPGAALLGLATGA
ncbi:hypothetical protein D3C71_19290 [compost metagenome]